MNKLDQILRLAALIDVEPTDTATPYWVPGKNYLVQTVTMWYTGRLVSIGAHEIVLDDAAWIASSGRYSDFLDGNALDECEPVGGPIIIGRGALVAATVLRRDLPLEKK